MLATELALKKIPVRVCSVAPGVYESEMTYDKITPDKVNVVGKGVVPVPENRPGTYVHLSLLLNWSMKPTHCMFVVAARRKLRVLSSI